MPPLQQITCSIELGTSNIRLKEYGHRYGDGYVECFVPVPGTDIPFNIHVQSAGYIAPGLAAFVFMDGAYQCNRNRLGLQLPGEGVPSSEVEADLYLRQREEKTSQGSFVGREWTFTKLNTGRIESII